MPAPIINPLLASDNPWSWIPSFSWGSPDNPAPQNPPLQQVSNGSGTQTPWGGTQLPPPNIPQMPPVPQGSGTQTPWGGPAIPNAATGPAVSPDTGTYGQMPEAEKKYSFMDNPGASDAMVAFGAAMLKAPDFNQGLGDAALAVNQVAKQYRMPTEQDYARAKMLGMTARLARGYDAGTGQTAGGVDVDQKTAFYGPGNKLYFAATGPNNEPGVWDNDGQKFVAGGVPGLVRATDGAVGAENKYGVKNNSDAEKQFYNEANAADTNITMLQQIKGSAAGAGVGLDFATRIGGQLSMLLGVPIGNIDPTDQSTLDAASKQLQLGWSQKMQGQGQVTENERLMIARMLPQALMDPDAFNNLVDILTQVEQRKKQMALEWFGPNQEALKQQYGSFMGYKLQKMNEMPINIPTAGTSGATKQPAPGTPPANPELDDALKQYGG